MPRGLTQAQINAASALIKRPAAFVHVDIPGDPIFAWDGAKSVNVLGNTYIGVGQFGMIEGLGGERATRATDIRITLHGLPTDLVPTDFLKNAGKLQYQNRPLKIYIGFCDVTTDVPLADPYLHWAGVADVLTTSVGRTVSASLTGENYSSLLRRTNGLRMSHESHSRRIGSSQDNFFKFVTRLLAQPKVL